MSPADGVEGGRPETIPLGYKLLVLPLESSPPDGGRRTGSVALHEASPAGRTSGQTLRQEIARACKKTYGE